MNGLTANGLVLGSSHDVLPWMLRYGASVDALLTCLEAYPYAMMDFWMRVWRAHGLEI